MRGQIRKRGNSWPSLYTWAVSSKLAERFANGTRMPRGAKRRRNSSNFWRSSRPAAACLRHGYGQVTISSSG
jgi:hypothetical protein